MTYSFDQYTKALELQKTYQDPATIALMNDEERDLLKRINNYVTNFAKDYETTRQQQIHDPRRRALDFPVAQEKQKAILTPDKTKTTQDTTERKIDEPTAENEGWAGVNESLLAAIAENEQKLSGKIDENRFEGLKQFKVKYPPEKYQELLTSELGKAGVVPTLEGVITKGKRAELSEEEEKVLKFKQDMEKANSDNFDLIQEIRRDEPWYDWQKIYKESGKAKVDALSKELRQVTDQETYDQKYLEYEAALSEMQSKDIGQVFENSMSGKHPGLVEKISKEVVKRYQNSNPGMPSFENIGIKISPEAEKKAKEMLRKTMKQTDEKGLFYAKSIDLEKKNLTNYIEEKRSNGMDPNRTMTASQWKQMKADEVKRLKTTDSIVRLGLTFANNMIGGITKTVPLTADFLWDAVHTPQNLLSNIKGLEFLRSTSGKQFRKSMGAADPFAIFDTLAEKNLKIAEEYTPLKKFDKNLNGMVSSVKDAIQEGDKEKLKSSLKEAGEYFGMHSSIAIAQIAQMMGITYATGNPQLAFATLAASAGGQKYRELEKLDISDEIKTSNAMATIGLVYLSENIWGAQKWLNNLVRQPEYYKPLKEGMESGLKAIFKGGGQEYAEEFIEGIGGDVLDLALGVTNYDKMTATDKIELALAKIGEYNEQGIFGFVGGSFGAGTNNFIQKQFQKTSKEQLKQEIAEDEEIAAIRKGYQDLKPVEYKQNLEAMASGRQEVKPEPAKKPTLPKQLENKYPEKVLDRLEKIDKMIVNGKLEEAGKEIEIFEQNRESIIKNSGKAGAEVSDYFSDIKKGFEIAKAPPLGEETPRQTSSATPLQEGNAAKLDKFLNELEELAGGEEGKETKEKTRYKEETENRAKAEQWALSQEKDLDHYKKYGIHPIGEYEITYRGVSKEEWDNIQNGGTFQSRGLNTNMTYTTPSKDLASASGKGVKADVVIEFKPEAKTNMREGDSKLGSIEYVGEGLNLSDVQRVTDSEGNVIYDATTGAVTTDERRTPVVGIGDLHGENPNNLKADMVDSGIIDSNGKWLTDKVVVQMGDVTDRGEYSLELMDFLSKVQNESGGKLVRVLGNHDLFHILNKAYMLGAKGDTNITKKLREAVANGEIVAAWSEGDTIYTHAGIDLNFFPEYKGKSVKYIVNDLNNRLMKAVETGDFSDKIFDTESGIFWTRNNIENKQFRQVVGHTVKSLKHTYKDGDRVKYIDTGRIFDGDRKFFNNTVSDIGKPDVKKEINRIPKKELGKGEGKKVFYRGGGEGASYEGTAQDIINYEQKELGNKDVIPVDGIDLKSIEAKNTMWVTEERGDAEEYGEVDEVPLNEGEYMIIARDGDGGVLIEIFQKPDKLLGQNTDGHDLYQDKNGFRYYVNKGVQYDSPISVTSEGVIADEKLDILIKKNRTEFVTEEERNDAAVKAKILWTTRDDSGKFRIYIKGKEAFATDSRSILLDKLFEYEREYAETGIKLSPKEISKYIKVETTESIEESKPESILTAEEPKQQEAEKQPVEKKKAKEPMVEKPKATRESAILKGKDYKEIKPDKPEIKHGEETTLKEQKKYIIDAIDDAIDEAPIGLMSSKNLEMLTKGMNEEEQKKFWEKNANLSGKDFPEYVFINVPGDGEFALINSKVNLTNFKNKIKHLDRDDTGKMRNPLKTYSPNKRITQEEIDQRTIKEFNEHLRSLQGDLDERRNNIRQDIRSKTDFVKLRSEVEKLLQKNSIPDLKDKIEKYEKNKSKLGKKALENYEGVKSQLSKVKAEYERLNNKLDEIEKDIDEKTEKAVKKDKRYIELEQAIQKTKNSIASIYNDYNNIGRDVTDDDIKFFEIRKYVKEHIADLTEAKKKEVKGRLYEIVARTASKFNVNVNSDLYNRVKDLIKEKLGIAVEKKEDTPLSLKSGNEKQQENEKILKSYGALGLSEEEKSKILKKDKAINLLNSRFNQLAEEGDLTQMAEVEKKIDEERKEINKIVKQSKKAIEEQGNESEELEMSSRTWGVEMPRDSETSERINKTQIIKKIEKMFGIPIRGKATKRFRAAGIYSPREKLIRLKKWGELEVLMHELAHGIDYNLRKIYGKNWKKDIISSEQKKQAITELADLDYDQKKRRPEEGYAEFMRYWLTTEEAQKQASAFYEHFEKFLADHEGLRTKLIKLKDYMKIWQQMGAEERIMAQIDWKGEHTGERNLGNITKRFVRYFQTHWIDELDPFKKIVKAIQKETGKELRPTQNPFELATYSKSKSTIIARTFVMKGAVDETGNKIGKSLLEVLNPVGRKDIKKFIIYGAAKRALDLHERGIESGFDHEDARWYVEQNQNEIWDKAVEGITEWSGQLVDWIVRAGGLSEGEAQLMRLLNPIYVPFKRAFSNDLEIKKKKGKFANTNSGIYKIRGSGRPIINPVESLISQASELILKAQKLRVAKAVAELTDIDGIGGFISEVPAPLQRFTADITDNLHSFLKKLIEEGVISEEADISEIELGKIIEIFSRGSNYFGKDNILRIIVKGEPKFFEVHPDLYQALIGLDPMKLPAVLKVFSQFARLVRLGATGLKMSFGLARNPWRDAFTYAVLSKNKFSIPIKPIKGLAKEIAASEGSLTSRFKRVGGELAGMMGMDRLAAMKTYDEMLDRMLGKMGKALHVVKHPIDSLRMILNVTEMGPRITELEDQYNYYRKKKPDWSEEDCFIKAFNDAQDVTINFTKGGADAKVWNEIAAFFKVAILGPEKVFRSLRDRPLATIVKGILYVTLLSIANWFKNKDKEWYRNLPPAYKYGNFWFELNEDTIIRLPIPFDVGVIFSAAPVAALDHWFLHDDESWKYFTDLVKGQAPNVAPTFFQPWYDVATNKNYLVVPIESRADQMEYVTEREKRYTKGYAKILSRVCDKMGVKLSPIQIDYILDAYTGGFLRQFQDTPIISDLILRMPEQPRRQLDEFFATREVLNQKMNSGILTNDREIAKLNLYNNFYERILMRDKNSPGLLKQIALLDPKKDREKIKELYGKVNEILKIVNEFDERSD